MSRVTCHAMHESVDGMNGDETRCAKLLESRQTPFVVYYQEVACRIQELALVSDLKSVLEPVL